MNKVDVAVPSSIACLGPASSITPYPIPVLFRYHDSLVGPLSVPANLIGPSVNFNPPGQSIPIFVWVTI